MAIPMKVIKVINKETAAVESNGIVVKEVNIQFLDNVKTGDYLIIHAGFAIEKINKQEAEKTLNIIKEMDGL